LAEEGKKPRERKGFRGEEVGIPLKVLSSGEAEPKIYPRYILELDKERVYVKCDNPESVGAKLEFIFDDPRLERVIELKGEVVRINSHPPKPGGLEPGMGIILDPVSLEDRSSLTKLFEEQETEDRTEELLRFLTWVRKFSQPMGPEEREKIKRDLLRALYGEERKPLSAQRKRREDIVILGEVPLFQELDPLELGEVAEILLKERIDPGAIIFNEGEQGDKFYIILKGEVEIFKKINEAREEMLAVLKPGTYFGEMSLIDQAPRSASARAKGEVIALTISKSDFELLLKASDSLSTKIYKFFAQTFSQRLRETDEKIKRIMQVLTGSGS